MGDWVRVPLTIQKVNVRVLKEEKMEVCYDLQGFIMIYNDEMMKWWIGLAGAIYPALYYSACAWWWSEITLPWLWTFPYAHSSGGRWWGCSHDHFHVGLAGGSHAFRSWTATNPSQSGHDLCSSLEISSCLSFLPARFWANGIIEMASSHRIYSLSGISLYVGLWMMMIMILMIMIMDNDNDNG